MNRNGSDRVQFGPFEADLHTHELWKYGTRLKLVGQPFEVLAILLSKPGELVTREELRDRLWPGDTFVDFNHGLNAAVNKLREALSDSAEASRYVETLPRRGYRFIAAVERQNADQGSVKAAVVPQPASLAKAADVIRVEPPRPAEASATRVFSADLGKVRRWPMYFVTVGVVVTIILAGRHAEKKVRSMIEARETDSPVQRISPLTSLADETSEPAFSQDGNYVAFRRQGARPGDSGIFVKAIASDQLIQLTRSAADSCPVWAPDGRSIAFARISDEDVGIYVVPFAREPEHSGTSGQTPVANAGGAERKLDTGGVTPKHPEVDWSPDGKTVAFSGGTAIFLLSMESHGAHRLVEPPPLAEDRGPAFSADGRRVLFVRSHATGFPEEIMAVATTGGEVTRITSEAAHILGPPRWSVDGQSVIYGSDRGSHPALWRVSADVRDTPVEINDGGWHPALSRKGYRLAYQHIVRGLSVWQLDLSLPAKEQAILVPSTSETDQGPGPQISPDGKKLAYMSDRSGTMEIWVSDRDGGNPIQLTAVGGAGTPRWSPDSQWIAFDARGRNGELIYVVNLQGGVPRLLTQGDAGGICPSWSRDGKWVYYASQRTSVVQVWKVPAEGGVPVQVTTQGGHAALESPDGKYVYYAKTSYANPEIWQIPVDGGAERPLSPLVRPATWASWAVIDRGIMFAGPSGKGKPVVSLFDFATRRVRELGMLETVPFWLGATRDGKTIVFDQPGWQQAQVMLVENFR